MGNCNHNENKIQHDCFTIFTLVCDVAAYRNHPAANTYNFPVYNRRNGFSSSVELCGEKILCGGVWNR